MKNLILPILFFLSITSLNATPAFIFSWGGEKVAKVADFPDNNNFKNIEGRYFDAGVRYKQVSILFIPLWNYEKKWCGYLTDEYYIDLTKKDLDELASIAGVTLPDEAELSFWEKIGGKLVLLALLVLYIIYASNSSDEETVT